MNHPEYEDCHECYLYGERRMSVLIPAMHERRAKTGESARQILDHYMTGVHARHLAGLSVAVSA